MELYGFGSNLFSSCLASSDELDLLSPVLLPHLGTVRSASWSATVFGNAFFSLYPAQRLKICFSIPEGACGKGAVQEGLPIDSDGCTGTDRSSSESTPELLGQDSFVVALGSDGRLTLIATKAEISDRRFRCAAMNGRGEILAVELAAPEDNTESAIFFFPSPTSPPNRVSNSRPLEPIVKMVAGAAHFLLLTSPSVLAFGDNRFGQSGESSRSKANASSSPSLHPVEFFDGLDPVEVATGDFHSAVVTADGSLYVFGEDKDGQCGGHGREPSLVDLGEGDADAQPSVKAVALGSAHSLVTTIDGQLWVTGLNHAGQLGLGDRASRKTFVLHPFFTTKRATRVTCSRWTSFVETTPPF